MQRLRSTRELTKSRFGLIKYPLEARYGTIYTAVIADDGSGRVV